MVAPRTKKVSDGSIPLHQINDLGEDSEFTNTLSVDQQRFLLANIKGGANEEVQLSDLLPETRRNYDRIKAHFPEGENPRIFVIDKSQRAPAYISFAKLPEIGPTVLITEGGDVYGAKKTST